MARWSVDEAREELVARLATNPAVVNSRGYDRWARPRPVPSYAVVVNRFGSWWAALAEVGITRSWTETAALDALGAWLATSGDSRMASYCDAWRQDPAAMPSPAVLQRLFGGWRAARWRAGHGRPVWGHAAAFDVVVDWVEHNSDRRLDTYQAAQAQDPEALPSDRMLRRVWGGWRPLMAAVDEHLTSPGPPRGRPDPRR